MDEMSEEDHHFREKAIKVLAAIGIPAAALLHGYVGFLFGAIKANPWWSTPLMPVIFLLSAIVSGIALLIVMYVVVMKILGRPIDHVCVSALGKWLLAFLVIDLTVEGLEILSMAYEAEESWDVVSELIVQRIPVSYFGIQLLLGSLIPMVILGAVAAQARREGAASPVIFAAAMLVIVGVFAMRWNVVIGGQMISKSMRGFTSYTPPLGGREGVLAASVLMMLPFYIFSVIVSFVPPWQRPVVDEGELSPEPAEAVPAWEGADSRVRDGAWDWERQ
jgi:Ni/Fe-hydrogenase subunit HybB-like protein